MKRLLVIVGPTAVGKTNLAIQLAQRLNCAIISCDSRQFYKEMSIGTAKPDTEELNAATHYFIDSHSIETPVNAMDFEEMALLKIAELHLHNDYVIMVGGSGLYVKAVCEGFDAIPDLEEGVRDSVIKDYEEYGLEYLVDELEKKDPEYHDQVDLKNSQRVMRAIEVIRGTGLPFSSFRTASKKSRPFEIVKIGIEQDRKKLYQRINDRMDLMLRQGLEKEARDLSPYRHLNALRTVGYQEIYGYMEGKYDWDECVRLLKRNSRRYAKRQLTWFKRDSNVHWFDADQINMDDLLRLVQSKAD